MAATLSLKCNINMIIQSQLLTMCSAVRLIQDLIIQTDKDGPR